MGMLDPNLKHRKIALNEKDRIKKQDGKNKSDLKYIYSTWFNLASIDLSFWIILNIKGFTLFTSISYIVYWFRICLKILLFYECFRNMIKPFLKNLKVIY